jgi:hypothetical protein
LKKFVFLYKDVKILFLLQRFFIKCCVLRILTFICDSKKQGQILDRTDIESPQKLLSSPNPAAALPPPPLPPTLPLDRKLSLCLHLPTPPPLSPPLCPPPCGDMGGWKYPRHGPRPKHTLCQNMNSTTEVRTIRVKQ